MSSVGTTAFPLGNGTFSTSLNIQHLETTVSALDGETILLGGMISRKSDKVENKVPWLGDLPGLGALFRYRTENKTKTELIIIMTPHIVRNAQEAAQVMCDESRRIDWVLSGVARVHGAGNLGAIAPPVCDPGMRSQPFRIYPGAQPEPVPPPQPKQMEGVPLSIPVAASCRLQPAVNAAGECRRCRKACAGRRCPGASDCAADSWRECGVPDNGHLSTRFWRADRAGGGDIAQFGLAGSAGAAAAIAAGPQLTLLPPLAPVLRGEG